MTSVSGDGVVGDWSRVASPRVSSYAHMWAYYRRALSDDRFQELLENGTINPGMKRNEASAETRKERKAEDEKRILDI